MSKEKKQKEEAMDEPPENLSAIHVYMDWETGKLEVATENLDNPVDIIGLIEMSKDLVLRRQSQNQEEITDTNHPMMQYMSRQGGKA